MSTRSRMASPLRSRRSMRVSPAVTSVSPRSPVRTAMGAAKKTTKKKVARKAPAKKTTTKKKTATKTRRSPERKFSPAKKTTTRKKAARKAPAKRKTARRSPGRCRAQGGLVVPAGATWMAVVKMSKGKKNPATGKAYTFKDLSKLYRK